MLIAVDKALKHRVVMLSGDEENPRRRSLPALLEAACPDGDDFDLEVVEADQIAPLQWVASAGTTPFLAPRRTVVVRHLLRSEPGKDSEAEADKGSNGASTTTLPGQGTNRAGAKDPKRPSELAILTKALAGLPESALLVLVADDEGGDTERQRRLKTIRTAWEKAVSEAKGFVYAFKADLKNVHSAVRQECERLGLKMSPKATDLLVEMTGGSLSRALDELEKLALYCGTEPVRDSDVQAVVVPAREWNVFKLVDAVVMGNTALALQQLRVLVGGSTHADAAANQGIFPNLSRQFRLLWQARLCLDGRTSPERAPASILACFPEKPNLAKEQDWQVQKAMRNAGRLNLAKIGRCMEILTDTNAELIGLRPAYTPMESLEQMVLKMIAVIRAT